MFFPRVRPPAVREEGLRSLWLALNTPELSAGDLPAGPARAAIALHEDAATGVGLSVVVRSLADGQGACWRWSGDLDGDALREALDAALSFAEDMGFLFDDDALAEERPEARRRAVDGWWEVAGWPGAGEAASRPAAPQPEAAAPHAGEAAPEAPRAPLPLTKFRRRLAPEPATEAASPPARPSALGRLRLVRRVRSPEGAERPPLWLRLLGSF